MSANPWSLKGARALVVGIANDQSIAWGIAKALHEAGAEIAVTYLNAKAEPHVRPLAEALGAQIFMPLDVNNHDQEEALFKEISDKWGKLDILVHSIAFAPKDDLHGRVVDVSRDGFLMAMDISVHSFVRLVKASEPLMVDGGTCMTLSFYGAEKVVSTYNIMGPVKASLEAMTRALAAELGVKGIRVNTLSPGAMSTRAARGIAHFDDMMHEAEERAPLHRLATIDDVGAAATFLASPAGKNITGATLHIDAGYHIMA